MNCSNCWQKDVCDPPDDIKNIGCEFHSKTRPTESEANYKAFHKIFRDYEEQHLQMRQLMVPLLGEVRDQLPLLFDNLELYR